MNHGYIPSQIIDVTLTPIIQKLPVCKGTALGSILGPFCYVFINDLLSVDNGNTDYNYADDSHLICILCGICIPCLVST